MSSLQTGAGVVRKSFGKIENVVPVPNLIEIQSKSFNDFVQLDMLPSEREVVGLEKVLKDVFPIEHGDKMSLEYVSYELGNWTCTCGKLTGIENRYTWSCPDAKKSGVSRISGALAKTARYKTCSNCLSRVSIQLPMTLDECRTSGQTFSLPLKVKVQLVTWDKDAKDNRVIRDIKEQDIFFADVPVMADLYEEDGQFKLGDYGTFLINGVDRVVVSQLHRSPGVVFSQSKKVKDLRGRPYYLARIIPMRGSWLDFEFDSSDHLYVRIDKKKKLLVTTFLQALGIERDNVLSTFYRFDRINSASGNFSRPLDAHMVGQRIEKGMVPENQEKEFVGKRITQELLGALKKKKVKELAVNGSALLNRVFARDLVDADTGEIIAEQGSAITEELLSLLKKQKTLSFELIASTGYVFQPTIALTLSQDKCQTRDEALKELHSKVWPGDGASLEEIKERLQSVFFNSRLYDLTRVGRVRINRKLGLKTAEGVVALTMEDIVGAIQYLVNLRERGEGELDDIDHLGNRRVRLVGELLSNQVYLGFLRIERIVKERFRLQEAHGVAMPQDFLNVKPLSAALREFFGTGQLSQFMDQTNPLSEVAHKRRLSALGPGGVMKDRATNEIRDVHTSHYGRICPIETPEGQTVGLISSLATYASVNDLGFIETAYRPVTGKKIKQDVVFMDAFQETDKYIAQADSVTNDGKSVQSGGMYVRHEENFVMVDSDQVDYIDLSPKQLVSVSAALIPFLEHDDASRALMGANMQRQAVPTINPQTALVATGMERDIGRSSGTVVTARRGGFVEYVSAEKIVVRADEDAFNNVDDWMAQGVDTYDLKKFQRSSHNTWINQSPIVSPGQRVEAGDVLSNGAAVVDGELALGSNLLVAFMPWHGYNFEDAIVLNKRLVSDDVFTSVYIDEYIAEARDTKLGPEEITRDIPNVSETALSSLDEDGIVKIGTRVKAGDILVGKVTLKGDVQFSPEEKLLRAIFGEKSREVRDTSLRVPPGVEGTVQDVKIFSRSGIRKDRRYKEEVAREVVTIEKRFEDHVRFLHNMVSQKAAALLSGALISGKKIDKSTLEKKSVQDILALKPSDKVVVKSLGELKKSLGNQERILLGVKEEAINRLKKGDVLPSGVIKMIKVYIAQKRSISVGDKIAGRHGNKGVVSNIVPREDMPHLEDGTAVDVVLNPLGVPSRMNVGQILETILGFAGKIAGDHLAKALEDAGYAEGKKMLASFFGDEFIKHLEKTDGKDGVADLARRVAKQGLHFETPVFDGADFNSDIVPLLDALDIPRTGTLKLIDGRTGSAFDQPVTVGSIYMMKLNHMIDDKLHARSVGPYSLVTQQPLGGKAQFGGQRLGEMEVWALEAYGAAYTLQEMLTYKSDDVNGRHKVYEAIIRSENVPEPGLPESFNVLIKELQSLGLQVDLFKSGKEEVGE